MNAAHLLRALMLGPVVAGLAMTAPARAAEPMLDKVSFGTNWVAEGEHGGFFQALADGTYRKYGLDVTIVPGGPNVNNRILLVAGKLDFFMSANTLQSFDAVASNVPVVAVAAIVALAVWMGVSADWSPVPATAVEDAQRALAYAALLAILAAIVMLLARVMPNWGATLIVGVVVGAVGWMLIGKAMMALQQADLTPRETVETLKEDATWMKQQIK